MLGGARLGFDDDDACADAGAVWSTNRRLVVLGDANSGRISARFAAGASNDLASPPSEGVESVVGVGIEREALVYA